MLETAFRLVHWPLTMGCAELEVQLSSTEVAVWALRMLKMSTVNCTLYGRGDGVGHAALQVEVGHHRRPAGRAARQAVALARAVVRVGDQVVDRRAARERGARCRRWPGSLGPKSKAYEPYSLKECGMSPGSGPFWLASRLARSNIEVMPGVELAALRAEEAGVVAAQAGVRVGGLRQPVGGEVLLHR